MPAEEAIGLFCASWWAEYEVPASKPGQRPYFVQIGGSTTPAHCTCPAFQFGQGPIWDRTCKHIAKVHVEACLWNEQWHEGNQPVALRPKQTFGTSIVPDETCPNCGGPVMAVRIAI